MFYEYPMTIIQNLNSYAMKKLLFPIISFCLFLSFAALHSQNSSGIVDLASQSDIMEQQHQDINPMSENFRGGEILWDLTHGVYMNYEPDGAYSSLISLLSSMGFNTSTTTAGVNNINLSQYDILVVNILSAWYTGYTAAEVTAILNFIENGGSLLLIGENSNCPNYRINSIAYSLNMVMGVSYLSPQDIYIHDFGYHPIFNNITELFLTAAGEIGATSPAELFAWTGTGEGVIAINPDFPGQVIGIGDGSFWANNFIGVSDNQLFAENVFNWLMLNNVLAPTNLSADLDIPTGEVMLTWDLNANFNEDFNDGIADNWIPVSGSWDVSGGSYNSSSTSHVISSSYYDQDYSNFELEARMRKTAGLNDFGMGLHFNGDPSIINSDGYWINGYHLYYSITGEWLLFKYVGGSFSYLQPHIVSPDIATGMGSWNKVKVVFADGYIDVYFNDVLQGTYFDNTFLIGKSAVAMYDQILMGEGEVDYVTMAELAKGYTFGEIQVNSFSNAFNTGTPFNPGTSLKKEKTPQPISEGKYVYAGNHNHKDLQYFKVYRDGIEMGTSTELSYTDYLPVFGIYDYEVTAYYDEGESTPAGPEQVEWEQGFNVDPSAFFQDLHPNQTAVQAMTIENISAVEMDFTLAIDYISDELLDNKHPLEVETFYHNQLEREIENSDKNEWQYVDFYKKVYTAHGGNKDFSNILVMEETPGGIDMYYDMALTNLGFPHTLVMNWNDLYTELISGIPWDLVIINSYGNNPTIPILDELNNYLTAGKCLIYADWAVFYYPTHPLLSNMGISYNSYYNIPINFFAQNPDHDIFNVPNDVSEFFWTDDQFTTDGQITTVIPGNTHLAFHEGYPTSGACVLNSEETCIFNAFQASNYNGDDNSNGKPDMLELIENQIVYFTGIAPPSGWLSVLPVNFTIPANSSELVDVIFNTAGLSAGTYIADITVSNEAKSVVHIPVTLNISILEAPTNLTADLDIPSGEVVLNWDYFMAGINEDFEDGVADNWIPVTGSWSVEEGSYNAQMESYEIASTYYDEDFSVFDFEVSLNAISGNESSLALYFNGNPGNIDAYGEWTNTYKLWYFWMTGEWNLGKIVDGVWTTIGPGVQISPDIITGLGVWNTARIVFADGNIDVYFNGVLNGSYFDNSFQSGKVGLNSWNWGGGTITSFDNILLSLPAKDYIFGEVNYDVVNKIYKNVSRESGSGSKVSELIGLEDIRIPSHPNPYRYTNDSRFFQYFNVYRDGAMIATSTSSNYTDFLPEFGSYQYEVTAFYDDGESEAAGPVEVIWEQGFSVNPSSLTEELYPDEISTQVLTIQNVSAQAMDFMLSVNYLSEPFMHIEDVVKNVIERSGINDRPIEYESFVMSENREVKFTFTKPDDIARIQYGNPKADLNIGVLGAELVAYVNDVQATLIGTGKFASVTTINVSAVTPTLAELQAFDAVIVWSDMYYDDPVTLGNNLADYVDAGGGVVTAVAEMYYFPGYYLQGRWFSQEYYMFLKDDLEFGSAMLGAIYDPGHPIMNGVSSFDGGFGSYRPQNGNLLPGTIRIADWTDGIPLITVKNIGGTNRAELAMWPVSELADPDSWLVSTDGALIMGNALEWVAEDNGWLTLDPPTIAVDAYSSGAINVNYNAAGLSPGIYAADIIISNGAKTEMAVPVSLTVLQPIYGELKVYLEGPFQEEGMMSNDLYANNFIPLDQPYSGTPWNYNGSETVYTIPNSQVIDWVLVELRETSGDASTATGTTKIQQRAGFLLEDGTIVDLDGSSPLQLNVSVNENLFVVIYHRNHIAIMAANPLSNSGFNYSYDFTNAENQVFGGKYAHKSLFGSWVMYAGDANADGTIDNQDKNDVWWIDNLGNNYLKGDMNMDGTVNIMDILEMWISNSGHGTQVPE